jgi:hypothetical protein
MWLGAVPKMQKPLFPPPVVTLPPNCMARPLQNLHV